MGHIYIITAIGPKDQPGIIAALSGAVYQAGGNLDDATMTRLHGAFATMIAARLPESGDSERDLRVRLGQVAQTRGLHVTMEEIPDAHDQSEPDHLVTAYGADRTGIVHRVSSLLAEAGVNVTDLDTRLAGAPEQPVYVMLLETCGGDWEQASSALAALAREIDIEIAVKELESEAL